MGEFEDIELLIKRYFIKEEITSEQLFYITSTLFLKLPFSEISKTLTYTLYQQDREKFKENLTLFIRELNSKLEIEVKNSLSSETKSVNIYFNLITLCVKILESKILFPKG